MFGSAPWSRSFSTSRSEKDACDAPRHATEDDDDATLDRPASPPDWLSPDQPKVSDEEDDSDPYATPNLGPNLGPDSDDDDMRVVSPSPSPVEVIDTSKRPVRELRQMAQELGVDVTNVVEKGEMVAAIRAARPPPVEGRIVIVISSVSRRIGRILQPAGLGRRAVRRRGRRVLEPAGLLLRVGQAVRRRGGWRVLEPPGRRLFGGVGRRRQTRCDSCGPARARLLLLGGVLCWCWCNAAAGCHGSRRNRAPSSGL